MRVCLAGWIFMLVSAVAAPPQSPYRQQYVGIYGIVDRIEFEPNEQSPQRIRIHGAFTVPVPMSSFQRQPARKGFLYFSMVPERAASTLKDWNALRAAAGTGQGVGFGHYWVGGPGVGGNPYSALVVTLHADTAAAAKPEPYPVSLLDGVVKMEKHEEEAAILPTLQEALRPR